MVRTRMDHEYLIVTLLVLPLSLPLYIDNL
jgi:hypothetical protein